MCPNEYDEYVYAHRLKYDEYPYGYAHNGDDYDSPSHIKYDDDFAVYERNGAYDCYLL